MTRGACTHLMAGPVEPAHQRSGRDAEHGRRFVVGDPFDVDELHDLPQSGG